MASQLPGKIPDKPGQTVIYLVRHGQTALNETDVLRGLLDPPLDDTGQEQASRLGEELGCLPPALVVASPLDRARQTAQPVAETARLEAAADQRLIDRDYGPWTGQPRRDVTERWGSVDEAPGVEPLPAVRARAVAGLTDIARRCPGRTVVAVSHDAVNREVLLAFDPTLGDHYSIPQDNGCFNTLELRDSDGWAVLAVNQRPDPRRAAS